VCRGGGGESAGKGGEEEGKEEEKPGRIGGGEYTRDVR